jgi:hypothetical protein
MIDLIENGQLSSDLDAKDFDLNNVGAVDPVPDNLVGTDDPRLNDPRVPMPNSITDSHVSGTAAILQSKLNLNGPMPAAWMGTAANQAAQGNLAEYIANKGQPGGYAPLDGTGKVPSANLPAAIGTGTVTSVGLTMPAELSVSGSPVTSSGTIAVAWANAPGFSWFGNDAVGASAPLFRTTPLPVGLIPNLDASVVASGVFAPARIPVAVGVGVSHAAGAVPDPGPSGTPSDYLARDMTYKTKPTIGPAYQPVVPNPAFSIVPGVVVGTYDVGISETVPGSLIFYSLTGATSGFQEYSTPVNMPTATPIWAYAAKLGYNNSNVVTTTTP